MLNVLFLTHRLPYAPNRGDRTRAYHLLREMSRFADVSLFSFVHDDDEADQAANVPFAQAVATSRVSRMTNLARASTRLLSDRPLTHLLLSAPDEIDRLSSLIESRRPDVVFAFCSGMARLALEPLLDGMPFIVDMVDVDSAKWALLADHASGPKQWFYRREARTLRKFEVTAVERAETTLVVNQREHDTLRALAPDGRIRVVEVGVDAAAFRPPVSSVRSPTVVFSGVLNYLPNEAGLLWFLDAVWPRVGQARSDARFMIVGAHPTRALRSAAARDASVALIGGVPAVQPYLWEASVAVAPLHLARGTQTKVLEALAAGLPVAVTPIVLAGLPEHARPGCLTASSADEFARAVVALLDETSNGINRADDADLTALGWSRCLEHLEDILRRAARRDRTSAIPQSTNFPAPIATA